MVQRVSTVAFEGIEVRPVDVQVQVAPGCRRSTSWTVNVNSPGPFSRQFPQKRRGAPSVSPPRAERRATSVCGPVGALRP